MVKELKGVYLEDPRETGKDKRWGLEWKDDVIRSDNFTYM